MAVAAAMVMMVVGASGAQAAAPAWGPVQQVDGTTALTGVSCSTSSFCMAVDTAGQAVIDQNGTWGAPVDADGAVALRSVSCPITTFCILGDANGDAVPYTNGTFGTSVNLGSTGVAGAINSVSCPTSAFCVAVDSLGNAYEYTSAGGWSAATGLAVRTPMTAVSCSSAASCLAVDDNSDAANWWQWNGTSWSGMGSLDTSGAVDTLSCASASYCLGADTAGNALTFNGASWTSIKIGGTAALVAACAPQSTSCWAGDAHGGALSTTNGTAWGTPATIDAGRAISALSCSAATSCVAVDGTGGTLTLLDAPPANKQPPTIAGATADGGTLTAAHGSWDGEATSFADQWERCDAAGAGCTAIDGAIGSTYKLVDADVGHRIEVAETATNAVGPSSPVSSAPSGVVTAAGSGGGGGGGSTTGGTTQPRAPRIAHVTVSAGIVKLKLACPASATDGCAATVTLSVPETIRGGKVITAVARPGGSALSRHRTITVAKHTVKLKAGHDDLIKLALNGYGRKLLDIHRRIAALLHVIVDGRTVTSKRLILRRPHRALNGY
jgi:hypothetical protein